MGSVTVGMAGIGFAGLFIAMVWGSNATEEMSFNRAKYMCETYHQKDEESCRNEMSRFYTKSEIQKYWDDLIDKISEEDKE